MIHRGQGVDVPANTVDHIDPVDGPGDPRFWDQTNWQALCSSCHSKKTATNDGGFRGKAFKKKESVNGNRSPKNMSGY